MAKSAGNILRVSELEEQGYEPLAFRYLCLTARYRTKLSFTEDVLDGAQTGLRTLRRRVARLPPPAGLTPGTARRSRSASSPPSPTTSTSRW